LQSMADGLVVFHDQDRRCIHLVPPGSRNSIVTPSFDDTKRT